MRLLRSLKKKKKAKSKINRDRNVELIEICEENLIKNIRTLLEEGKSAEEIIGFNTSLLVCLTSSEIIKKNK
jgi:hypothetical protein